MEPTLEEAARRSLETVLLIDDSLTVRIFVDAVLRDAGYRVTTVSNATAALAALERASPDLVLLDVRLPGTDTVALAATIRQRDVRGETLILLYSGRSSPDEDALVARCGAVGYVLKTQDPQALRNAIESAWRRHHGRGAST